MCVCFTTVHVCAAKQIKKRVKEAIPSEGRLIAPIGHCQRKQQAVRLSSKTLTAKLLTLAEIQLISTQ